MKLLILIFSLFILSSCSDDKPNSTVNTSSTPQAESKVFAPPTDAPILTITGKLTQFNHDNELQLDREQLLNFNQVTIKTSTLWTDGETTFKGPLIKDVLAAVGSTATKISAVAINEYAIEIPVSDLENYQVIFALEQNGEALSVRAKGPIWVMYPWDSDQELKQDKYYSRSIWQLNRIKLHD